MDEDIHLEDIINNAVKNAIQSIINDSKGRLKSSITKEIESSILQNFKEISKERVRISLNNIERELNASLGAERKGQISTKFLREIIKEEVAHFSESYNENVSDNFKQKINTSSKKFIEKSFNNLKSNVIKVTERLILRELTLNDKLELSKILSDKESMRYYDHPYSEKEVENWIEWNIDNYKLTLLIACCT